MPKDAGAELMSWDIAETMKAIELHHQVKLDLTMTPVLSGQGRLSVTLSAAPMPAYPNGRDTVRVTGQPPWVKTMELEGTSAARTLSLLYRFLLEMDWELSRVRWDQLSLLP